MGYGPLLEAVSTQVLLLTRLISRIPSNAASTAPASPIPARLCFSGSLSFEGAVEEVSGCRYNSDCT